MSVFVFPWLVGCPLTPADKFDPVTAESDTGTSDPTTTETTPTTPTTPPPVPFAGLKRGVWSYLEVPGMTCANGTATGIGVSPGDDPYRLVTLVNGGGACWDYWTCYFFSTAVNTASGWDGDQLAAEGAVIDASPLFDRADPSNPWADATVVLVPYCTGDLHMGASVQHYDPLDPARELHHAGAANMVSALGVLATEVPAAEQVWLVGFSAGGYGAQFHADAFASTWPGADLAVLADCAPLVTPWGYRYSDWKGSWDVVFPLACADCDSEFGALLDAQRATVPDARFGLIATRDDAILTGYMAYPMGEYFAFAVDGLTAGRYDPDPMANAFVIDTAEHVLLGDLTRVGPNGVVLGDWVAQWRDDDPAWTDED